MNDQEFIKLMDCKLADTIKSILEKGKLLELKFNVEVPPEFYSFLEKIIEASFKEGSQAVFDIFDKSIFEKSKNN